ncbi:glycosyltransferase [Sporolactobacillus sp. THM19-2]|uniref:glycosyltransferase n=1 Tax=Sporolactobacillus sp. THM19-2 TaxID=2511171 RepID=UPI0010201726|nr:glycosyltransferase [Sporolactobacillus sp. THM19-2]RYL94135.1 hypothetical protein EWH91_03040 [Sporolactobacillus sp. THM19-2]
MIHYVVGRNLGHLNKCVANLARFAEISDEPVTVYAFKKSHEWLHSNFTHGKIERYINPQKKAETLLNAGLVMHDWRDEIRFLKKERTGTGPVIGGVYHSDLFDSEEDTEQARKFKRQIRGIARESTDIFFHINILQPEYVPQLSTCYVPIPIIARDITQSPEEVKKRLGLQKDEPFILIQMGGGAGRFRYKFINEWYKKIDQIHVRPYRIVIGGQLEGGDFMFHDDRVRAPLFANGRNLIHAADLVISKPGMGILMDCISTGTPLLALPADTKEREAKNKMLRDLTGSDICLADNRMTPRDLEVRIAELMSQKAHFTKTCRTVPVIGADVVAKSMNMLSGCTLKELPDVYREILKITPFSVPDQPPHPSR